MEGLALTDLGILTRKSGRTEVKLARRLTATPKQVWAYLTDSARLPEWLAPGAIDVRIGGQAKLNFVDSGIVIDSKVSACELHRALAYAWGQPGDPSRPVRWDLIEDGVGTRLTLTLSLPSNEDVARSCAGWEAHLEMLEAALEGTPIKFPFQRFKESRAAYNLMLA